VAVVVEDGPELKLANLLLIVHTVAVAAVAVQGVTLVAEALAVLAVVEPIQSFLPLVIAGTMEPLQVAGLGARAVQVQPSAVTMAAMGETKVKTGQLGYLAIMVALVVLEAFVDFIKWVQV
jgi:hypothetical protein